MIRQFMRPEEIAEEFGLSKKSVLRAMDGMRCYIPERYDTSDFFGNHVKSVRLSALQDYIEHKDDLEMERDIPPLDRTERERKLGVGAFAVYRQVEISPEDMRRLAAEIVRMLGAGIRLAAGE